MDSKPATCLICLKNNFNEKNVEFFDLFPQEWQDVNYLNKLQNVLNAEIIVYEETFICGTCVEDLNKAYDFKEKVIKALDYWTTKFEESLTFENKINEEDLIDVNDNNGIDESQIFNEDIVSASVSDRVDEVENNCELLEPTIDVNAKEPEIEDSSVPCSKCKLVFSTSSELLLHECEKKESTKELEKKPKKRKKVENRQCDFCDLSFSKLWKLNKHLKIHSVDKKYVCTFCNQAFKQSYHLREHITSHTGERNFKCGVCGKSFQRLSSQKRHMRTHVALPGEKSKKTPFLCNICGKSFPYSNGAQRHMRIHTGDKRYMCTTCGKKFNQSTHLKVHLRTHTGERPYMCNICGDDFTLKASLHKHMNSHNNSKNDVKIFQNLEPNLSHTQCRNIDEDKKEFFVDDSPEFEGFLITCSQ